MSIWQVDFYRRPLQDPQGHPLWELVICAPELNFKYTAFCPQPQANAQWIAAQLQQVEAPLPDRLQVFRPQCLSLIETAATDLNSNLDLAIIVEPTRRTAALKQLLQERAKQYPQLPGYTEQTYKPTDLDQPPPLPLPDTYQGESWQFATLTGSDLEETLLEKPIPVLNVPEFLLPSQLKLGASTRIPGVVIYGGRRSLKLAQWLADQQPVSLQFIRGEPSGLVLSSGLCDRWVLLTFEDQEVLRAATEFEHRKQTAQGLHFLLIQPDDSGVTFTGLWLLQPVDS